LFVDIRSEVYPQPIYDTKFKLRWDDNNLYIAAVLQDNHLWATKTSNDSELWSENSFSLLIAADDSLFNYKQIDVNVLGTVTDLLMKKSYYDAPGQLVHNLKWDSNATVGVYTPGTINTPGDRDQYWSVEISVPFETLAIMTNRVEQAPNNNEVWFLQFARTQHVLRLTKDGQYEIAPNISGKWWAWQPSGAINLHLQDRWGLVQFKRTNTDRKFEFQNWHIYKALFDVLEAMKVFKAKNGVYASTLEELDIPPYLLSHTCVDVPEISMRENRSQADFDINVRSMVFDFPPAYIRSDKFVTMW
jgi:hypothetical protein